MPVTASASSRCPLPATPAIPSTSPSRTTSDTSRSAATPRSPSAEMPSRTSTGPPGSCSATRRRAVSTSRPTMSAASASRVVSFVSTVPIDLPAAQDGDPVGDGHHLVELVRDEDHRAPVVRHRAERDEERVGLLRGQHRRRLVEDEHLRLAVERLQDLHPLLLAHRELPRARAGVDGEAVALGELGDTPLVRARVEDEAAAHVAVVAEHDVLGDGERMHEPEVLVHHPDAGIERLARRVEVDLPPVELELTRVGAVQAGEDVRERALAGAVLAEQRVHLADGRLEVDLVVRDARRGSAS